MPTGYRIASLYFCETLPDSMLDEEVMSYPDITILPRAPTFKFRLGVKIEGALVDSSETALL